MTRGRPPQSKRPVRIDGLSIAEFQLREAGPRIVPDDRRLSEPYRIIMVRGLWRGIDVSVEPPTSTHPLQHFPTRAAAEVFAQELARIEGWQITDRTGDAS